MGVDRAGTRPSRRTPAARVPALVLALGLGLLAASGAPPAFADSVLRRDGSAGSGPAGRIPGVPGAGGGLDFEVGESLGERRGGNLIHSFRRFDVGRGDRARFTGSAGIDTVITRVTGKHQSRIDGAIRSEIPGASLFLLNSRGIVLGRDASIDVDGSVYIGTAQRLRFADGVVLETDRATAIGALTAAPAAAFGFVDGAAGRVKLDRTELALAPGSTFQIAARRIRVDRRLDPSARLVDGELVVEHRPTFDLPGGRLLLAAPASAGEVPVDGTPAIGDFVDWGRITLRGSRPIPDADDDDDGDRTGGPDFEPVLAANLDGDPGGRATLRGGVVTAGDWLLTADGGDVPGPRRAIAVSAAREIRLEGATEFSSIAGGAASGGEVRFRAPRIRLTENAEILSDTVDTGGTGDAGSVRIVADDLELRGDAEIAADADEGSAAAAGQVIVRAERVDLAGDSEISSDTGGTGRAGGVVLRVGESLLVRDQAGIFTNAKVSPGETGDAGSIVIEAPVVQIRGGVLSAAAAGASDGGNVGLLGADHVILEDAVVSARVRGGRGGNVVIDTGTFTALGSDIVADAAEGQGGFIGVRSDALLADEETRFDASADDPALAGVVRIEGPQFDLNEQLEALEVDLFDVSSLLAPRCDQRSGSEARSSLVANTDPPLWPAPDRIESLEPTRLAAVGSSDAAVGEGFRSAARAALEAAAVGDRDAADRAWERLSRVAEADGDASRRARALLIRASVQAAPDPEADPSSRADALLGAHASLSDADRLAREAGDVRLRSYALGRMAQLYRGESRFEEALWLARRAERDAAEANDSGARFRWQAEEGRILWALGRTAASLAARRRAVDTLDRSRRALLASGQGGPEFARAMSPVYLELVDALLESSERVADPPARARLLSEARWVVERFKAAELRDYFHDECVADLAGRTADLDSISARGGAAVVYPISFPDRLEILVTLPSGLERFRIPVGRPALERQVRRLRSALQRPSSDRYRASSGQLYDWLVRPYVDRLAQDGVGTLVFVPDGGLRSIPMAALWDGERFLVERFALALTPGLSLVDPRPLERERVALLAGGLSTPAEGFPALPKVPDEIAALQELLGGEALVDEGFERERIRRRFETTRPSVLHLATHAEFNGDADRSFLLTHDGRLTMDDLAVVVGAARFRERPLELLVLSACQTAIGDDRAALGLAGVAIQAGARSAVGSLWSIADDAAYELIVEFYRQLWAEDRPSRAVALQRAQVALIREGEFSHPFFWSPFLLVSSWL